MTRGAATIGAMKGCRPLTDREVEQIAAAFSGRYEARNRALFLLGVKTGFRISEMLSLEVRDVSPGAEGGVLCQKEKVDPALPGLEAEAAAVLRLGPKGVPGRITVRRRNMKGKIESRTVILHPEAKAALEDWIGELCAMGCAAPRTPLFISRVGRSQKTQTSGKTEKRAISPMQAYRILQAACQACGVSGQTGTHCMRKTFANKVYDALDHRLLKTQKALGHRSVNSTVEYLSFRQEEIDAAILST